MAYSRIVLSIASAGQALLSLVAHREMYVVIRALGPGPLCLSQKSVFLSAVFKHGPSIPLEVRCLMNGLFCASEAMVCDCENV
jgi:hypothetical protein